MTYDEFRILNEKPLLSVEEAVELSGLGQHVIRAMAADSKYDITLRVGNKIKIKRVPFVQTLNELDLLNY